MDSTPGNGQRSSAREEPTVDLLGGLLSDANDLVSAHAQQIKLEVRDELGSLKDTIKLTGLAIAVVVVAGVLLGQAAALGLGAASGLPAWASNGLVGLVVAIAGYLAYRHRPAGVDLVPSAAISSVQRDLARIAAATTR